MVKINQCFLTMENRELEINDLEKILNVKGPLLLPGHLILVIGKTGAGKNMVCKALQNLDFLQNASEIFKEQLAGQRMFYSSNGDEFRALIPKDSTYDDLTCFERVVKQRMEFAIPQYAWMPLLVLFQKLLKERLYKTNDYIVVNGSPRTEPEFRAWLETVEDPGRLGLFKKIIVVDLIIHDETATKRLPERNREGSTTPSEIQERLDDYKKVEELLEGIRTQKLVPDHLKDKVFYVRVEAEQTKMKTTGEFLMKLYEYSMIGKPAV